MTSVSLYQWFKDYFVFPRVTLATSSRVTAALSAGRPAAGELGRWYHAIHSQQPN